MTLRGKLQATFVVLFIFIIGVVGLNFSTFGQLDGYAPAVNASGSLRMRAYQLAWLSARSVPAGAEETANIRGDMAARVAEYDHILTGLEQGDEGLHLLAPSDAAVMAQLQKVKPLWQAYRDDVIAVMDEAYCHFNRGASAVDGLTLLDDHPNVVVLRAFSKAYGLAGLRIGFAISNTEISDDLRRVATPFTVTSLAQQAAIASLAAEDELNERVNRIVAERIRVFDELTRQGWKIVPSQASFLWLATGDDTDRIDEVMVSHGVFARCWSGEGIRLSIGLDAENDRAIKALSQAVKG